MIEQFTEVWGQWGRSWPLLAERLGQLDTSLLFRWIGQNLLLSLLIAAVDLGAGAALIRILERRLGVRFPGTLFLINALAAGIGLAGMLVFSLGWMGRLTAKGVLAVTLFQALLAAWGWMHGARRIKLSFGTIVPYEFAARAIALILLPAALLFVADLFQPVQEGDSTMYHMVAARHYLDHGNLGYHSGIRFNAQPHLSVLLYLRHWLLLGDDLLVKLFDLELVLLLVLTLAAGLRLFRARDGLALAIAFLLCSPVFAWMIRTEYADLMLTATTAAAAVTLAWAVERRSAALVILAAPAAGIAGAVKFQGLVIVAIFAALALALLFRRLAGRAWQAAALALVASTVFCGAGWWVRSWLATGTPVYPFLSGTTDLRRLMEVNASYGFGRSPLDFLLLPIRAVGHHAHRFADPYILGPVLLLAAAALLGRPRVRGRGRWLLLGGSALFALFWFQSGQVMRYLACALPVVAILFADAVRWRRAAALALAPLAAATWMLPSRTLATAFPPPVTYSQKEAALAESLPHYRPARFVNQATPPGARIYVWFCEDSRFYLQRPNDGDWFGPRSYFWLSTGARQPGEFAARLRAAGFDYLLLDRRRAAERLEMFDLDFAHTDFMRVWGTPPRTDRIYDDGRHAIYRLKD